MTPIRVLLVDDHALLRAGLRALLEAAPGITVAGEAATGEEGVQKAAELAPDVVLMDLSMPGEGGLAATRAITALGLPSRVLVLTVHAEEEHLLPVLEAGGSGYVTKQSADTELVEAIRTVARGDVFLYPSAARLLIRTFREADRHAAHGDDPLEQLSAREREVLSRTAEGYSSTEIGQQLHISAKTVETYRQRVMDKLDLHHRSALVRFALDHGLLVPAGA